MKLILCLLFLFCKNIYADSIDIEANEAYVEEAHKNAIALINTALENKKNDPYLAGSYYYELLKKLDKIQYKYPEESGYTFTACSGGTGAFTYASENRLAHYFLGNTIYFCHPPLHYKQGPLSQIIIHEAIHKIGILDHCMVSSMEIDIYYNANKTLDHTSAYYFECNVYVPENIRPLVDAVFPYKNSQKIEACINSGLCKIDLGLSAKDIIASEVKK